MKKIGLISFICLIGLMMFVVALPAQAALVQCGTSYAPTACNICDILQLFKRVIDYITFTLVPVFAGVMILVSGIIILLGGAQPEMVTTGKKMLTNTLIGVLIIYSSFMITNFIIKSLAGDNDIATSWFKLDCQVPIPAATPTPITPPPTAAWTPIPQGSGLSDQDARSKLFGGRVKIGLPKCTVPPTEKCGYFQGVQLKTINEVIALKNECEDEVARAAIAPYSCDVIVTDATGPGHSGDGHYDGNKIDIGTGMYKFIMTTSYFEKIDDTHYKHKATGAIYYNEFSHWDIKTF